MQGFGLSEGVRWCLSSDENVIQSSCSSLPFSGAMDWLQPCRSTWSAKNSNLQGTFWWLLFVWVRFQSWMSVIIAFCLLLQVYVDGTTTMSTHERKASIRDFYGKFLISTVRPFCHCWADWYLFSYWFLVLWLAVIYPSLLQLQRGVTDSEDKKQKAVCLERYRRRDDEENRHCSDIDIEREEECGICMETNSKIVLPNCNHAMCLKCYRDWYTSLSLSHTALKFQEELFIIIRIGNELLLSYQYVSSPCCFTENLAFLCFNLHLLPYSSPLCVLANS